ncbi:MAG: response regulator, partial [Gemmatimonadales bacterium]
QVRQQDRLSAAVTLVTLFAVLLVVRLLVGRLLNRPLAELSDIVGAYEVGDYARSAASIRYVEFRQFGAVLDSMRQKIRGQLDELQAANVRLSEEALVRQRAHEAERLLRAAIEQTPDSVVISDTTARIVYVNPAFTAVTGYTREEAVGASTRLLESGEHDEVFFAGLWEKVRNGATWHGHLVNQKKGGERFVEDAIIAPVRNDAGAITNYIAVKRDITRELEREEQLRHAQRMEAVGQLAGGVAHDFNNILGAITMELEMLELEQELTPAMKRTIQDVRESVDRAANLTRQLLMFSRRQAMSVQVHDLNVVVADLLRMLKRVIGERIIVSFARPNAAVPFTGDSGMIEQVVMNLCVNARDAMPDGGRLTISTSVAVVDEDHVHTDPGARPGRFACLEVADTGSGMSASTRHRIFEPFFTTKDVGKGTGLGLATTHGLVAQHDGWIEVDSELGRGSTFRVYLPAAESETVTAEPAREEEIEGGSSTVLVVEDEALLRRLIVKSLRRLGYAVLEASHGVEAMQVWGESAGRIDVLLTDMVMPQGLSGIELGVQLRQKKPQLKVVVMSGYSTQLTGEKGVAAHEFDFLSKPFTLASLGSVVRRALERSSSVRSV